MPGDVESYPSAPEVAYSSQPERAVDAEGLRYNAEEKEKARDLSPSLNKSFARPREKIWAAVLCILSALVALGVGIGIGYAAGNSSTPNTRFVTVTSTVEPPAPTATLDATSLNVNRGIVGITPFTCANHTTYSSPYGVEFGRVCNVDYSTGDTVYGTPPAAGETVDDIFELQTYTFEACMDTCAQYNSERALHVPSLLPCKAVTYTANITAQFLNGDGTKAFNCYLKSGRGIGEWGQFSDVNYAKLASAYLVQD